MIPRSLLIATLLPALSAHATPQDEPRHPTAPPARTTLPEGGVVLPLVPDRPLPMIEVHLGDAGPFRFVVEWAGNVLAVSERVRDAIGLEVIARSPRGEDVVAVPMIRAGGARFDDLVAVVPPFFSGTDHDGLLGLNVFRELLGTLDFPRGELRLSEDSLPSPSDDPTVIDYSPGPGGSPRVPIELAGQRFEAVLDTAAAEFLILDESFVDRLLFADELRPGPVVVTGGMGRVETFEGTIEGDLVVGAARSSSPRAMFHRMQEPEILLGGGFLRDWALTLDQRNRRLRLAPGEKPK